MKIEIVEFFPVKRDDKKNLLQGTMRLRLPEIGINILGVNYSQNKKSIFFTLPGKWGFNKTTKKDVRYPIFSFSDKETQDKFIKTLRSEGKKFIDNWLKKNSETAAPIIKEFVDPPPLKRPLRKPLKKPTKSA